LSGTLRNVYTVTARCIVDDAIKGTRCAVSTVLSERITRTSAVVILERVIIEALCSADTSLTLSTRSVSVTNRSTDIIYAIKLTAMTRCTVLWREIAVKEVT
jgi:hypothetical protein